MKLNVAYEYIMNEENILDTPMMTATSNGATEYSLTTTSPTTQKTVTEVHRTGIIPTGDRRTESIVSDNTGVALSIVFGVIALIEGVAVLVLVTQRLKSKKTTQKCSSDIQHSHHENNIYDNAHDEPDLDIVIEQDNAANFIENPYNMMNQDEIVINELYTMT
uniref:uncharacterized protein LOC120330610 n=1 Tax=Styela clava TaxID=7725 RepID=UPI00193ABDFB|nr:uncharacterized protein LOC120330610 [Styela clava]